MKPYTQQATGRARLSLLLLLALPLAAASSASEKRFFVTPSVYNTYSGNIYWDAEAVADGSVSPGVELAWQGNRFTLSMAADTRMYINETILNSTRGDLTLEYFLPLSKSGLLRFAPSFALTRHVSDFSFLNSRDTAVEWGWKQQWNGRWTTRLGGELHHTAHDGDSIFDRDTFLLFVESNLFLPTQTGIVITAGWHFTRLPHFVADAFAETPALPAMLPGGGQNGPGGNNPGGGPGNSPGNGGSNGGGNGGTGNQRGNGGQGGGGKGNSNSDWDGRGGQRIPPTIPPGATTTIQRFAQTYLVVALTQAVGGRISLYGEYQHRFGSDSLADVPIFTSDIWAWNFMKDDYLWQGDRYSIGFRGTIGGRTNWDLGLHRENRSYPGTTVLDESGMPVPDAATRRDRRLFVAADLSVPLGRLAVNTQVEWRSIRSNDSWFSHRAFTVSLGLDYNL